MIGFQDLYRIFFQILWRLFYNSMGDLSDYALPFVLYVSSKPISFQALSSDIFSFHSWVNSITNFFYLLQITP